jgi:hypothetical protein
VSGRRHRHILAGPSGLAAAEGCWGTALLFAAGPLLRPLAGEPVDPRMIKIARVLGARQLLQSLIVAWRPTRRNLEIGAAVDAMHAATMFAAAAANIAPRRLTIASAATASALAAIGLAQSRRPSRASRRP